MNNNEAYLLVRNQDALEYCKKQSMLEQMVGDEKWKHYKYATKALKKQIPKKPNGEQHCGETYWYCPSCGEWCDSDHIFDDYCNHCGQALDWSEIE